jgi:hypothetical protein
LLTGVTLISSPPNQDAQAVKAAADAGTIKYFHGRIFFT